MGLQLLAMKWAISQTLGADWCSRRCGVGCFWPTLKVRNGQINYYSSAGVLVQVCLWTSKSDWETLFEETVLDHQLPKLICRSATEAVADTTGWVMS